MVLMVRKIYKRDFKRDLNHIIWFNDLGDMIFSNQIIG
jgi:hypothetical protein